MEKSKKIKYQTEDQKEVRNFFLVLIGVIIIIVGIYFFTRAFVTKDLFTSTSDITYTDGSISSTTAIVGTMLNRSEDEYYVLIYDTEGTKANYYSTLYSLYVNSSDSIKVYVVDLANELNKKYIASEDEKVSTKYTSLKDLKLGEVTLIKVKNGAVKKYITNVDDIKEELAI
jgi:hypothetical protein